jgi:hypothetical protein
MPASTTIALPGDHAAAVGGKKQGGPGHLVRLFLRVRQAKLPSGPHLVAPRVRARMK